MLSQVTFWAERAGMVMDLVLLGRILALKLHRTYFFILLFAVLSLFYDGVALMLGTSTEDFIRVVILSRFLYAVVYPLVLWDLFEEAKPLVEKVRRLAISRMISSLIFITVWGLLIAAFTGRDDSEQSHYLMSLAVVVWTGSVAASLAFLWVMRRGIRANAWQLPHNTNIWFRFFQLLLVIEAVACAQSLLLPSVKAMGSNLGEPVAQAIDPILQFCEIVLTGWCVFKLRPLPSKDAGLSAEVNA